MKLQTTDKELNALQHTVNATRAGAGMVKVSREALRHLLADHAALHTLLRRDGKAGEVQHQDA